MREWWLWLGDQVDVLTLRERGLLFLSGIGVISVIWTLLIFDPQYAVKEAVNLQMQAVQQKLSARTQEATVLAQMVETGVDQTRVRQLSELKKETALLGDKMSELSIGLIPANELLDVLRDVLQRSNELTILRIEILPPVKLNNIGNRAKSNNHGIFKHTVELTLQGSYFNLLTYLQGLEELPWRLYWDSLKYRVSGYPLGDIELRVSTLSMSGVLFENKTP